MNSEILKKGVDFDPFEYVSDIDVGDIFFSGSLKPIRRVGNLLPTRQRQDGLFGGQECPPYDM
ncbi:MAG: hypothetical protein IKZ88_04955 [Neisseriaceae bacterium]|nr:hypothetical protein [Neisseriaceae bacterium]